MCFPGRSLKNRFILIAEPQTCQLFENDLTPTCKRSTQTNSDFIALSILISKAIKGRYFEKTNKPIFNQNCT